MTVEVQATRYVSFDGCQVAIDCAAPEVLAGLERHFQQMLEPGPSSKIVARLKTGRDGRRYFLRGELDSPSENRTLSDILCRLNSEVVLHLVRARADLVWLHAGAAARDAGAVLISGVAGRGKSTIVTSLFNQGWCYLSDDVIPLDPRSGNVMAFPQMPMVRIDPGRELPPDRIEALQKRQVTVSSTAIHRHPIPIEALVFPEYNPTTAARLVPFSPSQAAVALLQSCLNFPAHREAAVDEICRLVRRLPAFHLSFHDGHRAAETIIQARANGYHV
jgi:hypothetical protein